MHHSLEPLNMLSPLDGRYFEKTRETAKFFSEYALIKNRIFVEIEYLIELVNKLYGAEKIETTEQEKLRNIYLSFTLEEAKIAKEIEKKINHDVKAVEYYIRQKIEGFEKLKPYTEFVHFGLTSQDINNCAFPLMMRDATRELLIPTISEVIRQLQTLSDEYQGIPMLARTHGQPASPTLLSKEIDVFIKRLNLQLHELERVPYPGKFGGATGNLNAHYAAYPDIDWHSFADDFVKRLGLSHRSHPTTQIEHYDFTAAWCHAIIRINTILIDLCRDFWTYISMDYFKQKIVAGEVGSSAMPHKVNPIDFENAEGNLGLANALLGFLAEKLPISRLQRDLTDSTVLRNIGVPVGHTIIALQSLLKGLKKVQVNKEKIAADLNEHWEVIAEGIQTILRSIGYPNPYEKLKELTRTHEKIDKNKLKKFVNSLDIPKSAKDKILALSPETYTGKVK